MNSRQKALREGLAREIAKTFDRDFDVLKPKASHLFDEYTQNDFLRMADRHIASLTEQGLVFKVPCQLPALISARETSESYRRRVRSRGFTATEPLTPDTERAAAGQG